MSRPRTRSDSAILAATRSLLLERGPSAPISAFAKKAGLSAPAILGRFGSRGALVAAALCSPSPASVLAALHADPQPGVFHGQLRAFLLALGDWLAQAVPCQIVHRMSPPAQRPRPGSTPDELRLQPAITIWLARAQARGLVAPGDPRALAATVLHTLQGHALSRLLEPKGEGPSLAAVADQLVALLTALPAPPPLG